MDRSPAPTNLGLTYPEVGATRDAPLPAGYRHVRRDVVIGEGAAVFERATAALMSWRMHRAAGLAVAPGSAAEAVPGAQVLLRLGWGPLSLKIPCRVVYCLEQPRLRGFAYGTLPGHPERGEEAFAVQLTASGQVRFRITAFSRPATLLARAGGPVGVLVQEIATNRYVSALRRLSRP
ncbi:DUF1990 family protein [Actinoplanes aureus]|uniref:DUF1990 domain-containing protein n=1 Tax=Actinoplanes aureus TaxID=2792083 RepID=A0A931FZJ6_9ACTN|nr:DUF1990 domain-containing protein [Actinoplanes aureus]MBG0564840.1 DUF1990 domain-containing protein [Actinoplanes aureus]